MANAERSRLAVEAWREHLITAPEALEISGLASERELQALADRGLEETSAEQPATAR